MPLMPKRVKYRKTQRGSRKGMASRNLPDRLWRIWPPDLGTRLDYQYAN